MITNSKELYEELARHMDHAPWWNTTNPWEIMIGAILVQNTNWKNVAYSLVNIHETIDFIPEKIVETELSVLEDWIRPSGFYKNKSRTIKALFEWLADNDFDLTFLQQKSTEELRKTLLSIKGIGPETADVLLVFVFDKVVFIADSYAQRIFKKLGIKETLNYKKLQALIKLPSTFTTQDAQNFHGWLVRYGQTYLKSEETWQTGFLHDFPLNLTKE